MFEAHNDYPHTPEMEWEDLIGHAPLTAEDKAINRRVPGVFIASGRMDAMHITEEMYIKARGQGDTVAGAAALNIAFCVYDAENVLDPEVY